MNDEDFGGMAMMAVGGLIVALCGLCTFNVARGGGLGGLEYIVGGIPILAGAGVFVRGWLDLADNRRRRSGRADRSDD